MSYVLGYILLISTRNWKIQTNCCPRADDLENFKIEKLQFLKYKNKYLLFLRNLLQAPLPKEYWSSQGDTWCPKGFWRSCRVPEVERGLGVSQRVPEGPGSPRGPGAPRHSHFSNMPSMSFFLDYYSNIFLEITWQVNPHMLLTTLAYNQTNQ